MNRNNHPTISRFFLTLRLHSGQAPSLFAVFLALLTLTGFSAACAPSPDIAPGASLSLASFSENSVDVSIRLVRVPEGYFLLEATFTPPAGDHLYSKDLPLNGVDGLGRPTLLEIPGGAKMQALGELIESVPSVIDEFEFAELPVYPAGAVTLDLPISLPAGAGWINDIVSVTFMACNEKGCKPPIIGKIVTVRVPGQESVSDP